MRLLITILLLSVELSLNAQSLFDLRNESFESSISLDGSWEFNYGSLLTGNEPASRQSTMVQVPHDWGRDPDNNFPVAGFGTYQTTVLLPKAHKELGLFIPHAFSAYRLFFNGELIHNQGDVQETAETYLPFRTPQAFDFARLESDTLRITIQVANFGHNNAGLYYPVEIGLYKAQVNDITNRQYINMFLAGGLFLTGFILLTFSFTYNQLERAIPFYALFSLSLMYRMLGADPYPIHLIFPDMPYGLSVHLEYLSIHSAAFFGGLFIFALFPKQTHKWIARVFYWANGISVTVILLTPPIFFTSVLKYYLFFVIAYVIIFTYIIYKAKRANEPTSGYLITALSIVFVWTVFQVVTFLGLGSVPYIFNVLLVSLIVIVCNLALFRTFMLRINRLKVTEAEVDFEKRKNTMLSLISHEIKMPVATLQMNMEMMRASKDNPEKFDLIKDKMIDLSYTAVDSIKRMLHDFIYFMSPRNNDLQEMDGLELIQYLGDIWELKIEFNSDLRDENKFNTDKITLKYVLNTLVSNAIKYSKPDDKEPEFILNQKSDHLLLELRDYGIGIAADQMELMGTPQAKVSDNQEVSGMGYYLAKDLTERLGHNISITSRGKEGTSVFIQFKTT